MDRETLVSAFAVLWADMAKLRELRAQCQNLKSDSEARLGYIIGAIYDAEIDHATLDEVMREAIELSSLEPDHPVIQVVKAELQRIEYERKLEAIRQNAAMN